MTDAYVPLTGPPTWQHAACRGEDPELWFPLGDTGRLHTNPDGETAIDICGRCEHRLECIAWAIKVDARDGIWGGLRPTERDPFRVPQSVDEAVERERRRRRHRRRGPRIPLDRCGQCGDWRYEDTCHTCATSPARV